MNKESGYAPIVLFVYNRLEHTKKTIEALKKNELASKSMLFIYSDAEKDDSEKTSVGEVRNFVKSIKGFKTLTVIERDKNFGLADSIIKGVTEVVTRFGNVIVIEDDIVTSPYFLKFMNEALEFYKDQKKVWHISGWNYPIDSSKLDNVFLWRFMNCWGWATWSDRWQYFEKNVNKTINEFSKKEIKYLNLDNYENTWSQVIANKENKINTWAIFWYTTIIKHNGLCLNPSHSLVINIGNDGSGEHDSADYFLTTLSKASKFSFTSEIRENFLAVNEIKSFYKSMKKSIPVRIIDKVKRIVVNKIKMGNS